MTIVEEPSAAPATAGKGVCWVLRLVKREASRKPLASIAPFLAAIRVFVSSTRYAQAYSYSARKLAAVSSKLASSELRTFSICPTFSLGVATPVTEAPHYCF